MKRHAYLLAQAEVDTPGADPRHKAELDDMFNKRVPQQVEADYRKLVPPDASKGWASKAFVCGANRASACPGRCGGRQRVLGPRLRAVSGGAHLQRDQGGAPRVHRCDPSSEKTAARLR